MTYQIPLEFSTLDVVLLMLTVFALLVGAVAIPALFTAWICGWRMRRFGAMNGFVIGLAVAAIGCTIWITVLKIYGDGSVLAGVGKSWPFGPVVAAFVSAVFSFLVCLVFSRRWVMPRIVFRQKRWPR